MKNLIAPLAAVLLASGCGSSVAVVSVNPPTEQRPSDNHGPYPKVAVTGSTVNLRQGPGTVYAVLGTVSRGDTLLVTGEAPDWYSVYIPERSLFAWIHSSLTTVAQLP